MCHRDMRSPALAVARRRCGADGVIVTLYGAYEAQLPRRKAHYARLEIIECARWITNLTADISPAVQWWASNTGVIMAARQPRPQIHTGRIVTVHAADHAIVAPDDEGHPDRPADHHPASPQSLNLSARQSWPPYTLGSAELLPPSDRKIGGCLRERQKAQ
jgi:CTP:molybdopterin cytidylyltransferase MocA